MSGFTGKLKYTRIENGFFEIIQEIRFYIDDSCSGEYVELFAGAVTNFASVPKVFWFICQPDADDIKMPSAFHDLMVSEFGQQIFIKEELNELRIPSWKESAFWFRKMIKVRQEQTRKKFNPLKKLVFIGVDFFFRWSCWSAVMVHGYRKNKI